MADSTSPASRQVHDTYPRAQRRVLTSIALGAMLVPLNSTMMIAVALPDIMQAFAVDVSTASWLVTAYLITMAALQLVAGHLGDRFGRRRLVLGANQSGQFPESISCGDNRSLCCAADELGKQFRFFHPEGHLRVNRKAEYQKVGG